MGVFDFYKKSVDKIVKDSKEAVEKGRKDSREKQSASAKRKDIDVDLSMGLLDDSEESVDKLTNDFREKAKSFAENLDKLPPAEAERVRKLAYSTARGDLQGWEWLDLSEEEADKRHLKLAQAFLVKSGDREFVVREDLFENENTRLGLGIANLLPPSIKAIEVTDASGRKIQGVRRQEANSRVAYYDENNNPIRITKGCRIKGIDFIDENGDEYKKQVEAEVANVKNNKAVAEVYRESHADVTREERQSTASTRRDYVSSIRGLERSSRNALSSVRADKLDAERVMMAKHDWERMKAVLNFAGIDFEDYMSNEAYGATYILRLGGKGAEMLGWNEDLEKSYKEKVAAGMNQQTALKEVAEGMTLSPVAQLFQAMQKGGDYLGLKFKGGYRFDLAYLARFNNLLASEAGRDRLKSVAGEVSSSGRIDTAQLIESLFKDEMPDAGLSLEEVMAYAEVNPNFRWLVDKSWRCSCCNGSHVGVHKLIDSANKLSPKRRIDFVDYQWNLHKEKADLGRLQCARTVSDVLGLNGKYVSVTRTLAPALIEANMRTTGKTGIVFGLENYREGDVVIWRGATKGPTQKLANGLFRNYGHNRFSHTGIVRHVMDIGGEKYVAIQHDQERLYIDLVPVNPSPTNLAQVRTALKTRDYQSLLSGSKDPVKLKGQFDDVFNYRPAGLSLAGKPKKDLVRLSDKTDAARVADGRLAFAIRTQTLARPGVS